MTVSGLTMISASRQSFQSLERQTQKRRSGGQRFGRLTVRLRTRSCCRRTRISVASDILEKNRDRKNRKNAEKVAIRVERSISDEATDKRIELLPPQLNAREIRLDGVFTRDRA